jgi:hypothetical protein
LYNIPLASVEADNKVYMTPDTRSLNSSLDKLIALVGIMKPDAQEAFKAFKEMTNFINEELVHVPLFDSEDVDGDDWQWPLESFIRSDDRPPTPPTEVVFSSTFGGMTARPRPIFVPHIGSGVHIQLGTSAHAQDVDLYFDDTPEPIVLKRLIGSPTWEVRHLKDDFTGVKPAEQMFAGFPELSRPGENIPHERVLEIIKAFAKMSLEYGR